jgi:hypothetical protein
MDAGANAAAALKPPPPTTGGTAVSLTLSTFSVRQGLDRESPRKVSQRSCLRWRENPHVPWRWTYHSEFVILVNTRGRPWNGCINFQDCFFRAFHKSTANMCPADSSQPNKICSRLSTHKMLQYCTRWVKSYRLIRPSLLLPTPIGK